MNKGITTTCHARTVRAGYSGIALRYGRTMRGTINDTRGDTDQAMMFMMQRLRSGPNAPGLSRPEVVSLLSAPFASDNTTATRSATRLSLRPTSDAMQTYALYRDLGTGTMTGFGMRTQLRCSWWEAIAIWMIATAIFLTVLGVVEMAL